MSKGLEKRRRLKRALAAARGNLHKIANGKALPNNLPEAPKDVDQLPASLRKMLALKEMAAQKDRKGVQVEEAIPESRGKAQGRNGKRSQQQPDGEDGPSTSGRSGPVPAQQKQQQQKDGGSSGAKGGNPFTEQFVERKLKDRKKEYLKRKQEKKRQKPAGELVVEKELQLRDKVQFGEVVHAPLEINLKRKHWVGKEKTANERCKEIFLKQLQQAEQVAVGGTADEGTAVGGGGKAGSGAGGAHKGKKRKAPTDEETAELRQHVIDAYRAAKRGGGSNHAAVGNATLSSLARLVGRSSDQPAAATHTLS